FVVAVLDASGHKRWVFVKHILHPKGNRGVIQPGAPSTGIVFGRRYGHDIFLLVLLHLDVLAAVLCKARYLGGGRRWQVKRVRCNQIESNPLAHFPRAPRQRPTSRRLRLGRFEGTECTCETDIVIFVLVGVVNYCANIQALHPRISWAVVEQTEIGAAPWQRTGQGESWWYDFARDTKSFCSRQNLKLRSG